MIQKRFLSLCSTFAILAFFTVPACAQGANRTIVANVVALDQPFMWNRLGTSQPNGMVFALRHDVTSNDNNPQLRPGKVILKPYKRPRPMVLRANVGDILEIHFTNLLSKSASQSVQPEAATRNAGVHLMGLELVGSIASDASYVGRNPSSLTAPGESKVYSYYAREEGTFLLYSTPGDVGGQLMAGLFGAVNVQPKGAVWYRSQVTRADLAQASSPNPNQSGFPIIKYDKFYQSGPREGYTVLKMLQERDGKHEIVHSDLTAIIAPPEGDSLFARNSPTFHDNPVAPNRNQPYREFTIIYHIADDDRNGFGAVQAFQEFYNPNTGAAFAAGRDNFAINYGMGGIGAEIIANRLGVGPMGSPEAVDLKFEEFFLTAWSVGDPAMVVDVPANAPNQLIRAPQDSNLKIVPGTQPLIPPPPPGTPAPPPPWAPQNPRPLWKNIKAQKALYPDDPSNVYHSYMSDHVKFRILHGGEGVTHVHHLHTHQWLHSPNSDNGDYLDSQMINPGASYTLEITYNGSGNLNKTVGDAIFHCHFYPHFAAGMWSMWRVHDVLEMGTELDQEGQPLVGWNRALPDGEIYRGTPIPAITPLPFRPMAPLPARVMLTNVPGIPKSMGRRAVVHPDDKTNPGFPFFIPGVAGHRPPHPPLDHAWQEPVLAPPDTVYLDGGLPRHVVLDGKIVKEAHTRWDFTKDFILYDSEDKTDLNRKPIAGGLVAFELPERGTPTEKVAMKAHATPTHPTFTPEGTPGIFILNGLPPRHGAPYAEPAIDTLGHAVNRKTRRYKAAVIQTDVVLNKKGWHYPQQRFLTLWEDVKKTVSGERAPEPFFFRANSHDPIDYWHTNLVPDYYDLDDFQVRTPTDVLGQHIHLVKFDVTSSDGAANGFNYEDGTFSPDEVRNRIDAINLEGGLYAFDDATQFQDSTKQTLLKVKNYADYYKDKNGGSLFGPPPYPQNWNGAQTTIQRWYADPIYNNKGFDRTLRTVFTHDHFSPSTHQQIGLYAGLLIEPENSTWLDPVTRDTMGTRNDGGPTSWQANIVTHNRDSSYREFALEFQDFQLAYTKNSPVKMRHPSIPDPKSSALFAVTGNKVDGLVNDLNSLSNVQDSLRLRRISQIMAQNGLTLFDSTTVKKDDQNQNEWLIQDFIEGASNRWYLGARFGVRKALNGLKFYTPDLESWSDSTAIGPANRWIGLPAVLGDQPPFPGLISMGPAPGTYSLNYRNEPLPIRVNRSPENKDSMSAPDSARAVDLSYAFSSIERLDKDLNSQPKLGAFIDPSMPKEVNPRDSSDTLNFQYPNSALTPGMGPYDPFTPMLRAYQNDQVQIRTLVGAHMRPHFFTLHGLRWFFEPTYPNSGYKNTQGMSLSEHFEMLFTLPPTDGNADYLYIASSGTDGLTNGLWGLLRAYEGETDSLLALPNNLDGRARVSRSTPPTSVKRKYHVVATTAQQALGGPLVYNSRGQAKVVGFDKNDLIDDPNALIFVLAGDLDESGMLKNKAQVAPLILRASAGEWIQVKLTNKFKPSHPKVKAFKDSVSAGSPFGTYPKGRVPQVNPARADSLLTSQEVGLHAQLVSYDITKYNGVNIGRNPIQSVKPDSHRTVYWYAGIDSVVGNSIKQIPVEFGSINLTSSDPMTQHKRGLVGALIIEPKGATWQADDSTRVSATVEFTNADGIKERFREFVLVTQDDVAAKDTPFGLNYKIEPMYYRYNGADNFNKKSPGKSDLSQAVSNSLLQRADSTISGDPQTPIFIAKAGDKVRIRVVHPGGTGNGQVLTLHGHVWQEEPYVAGATRIGDNPQSQWFGSRQYGANDSFEILLDSAGGTFKVPGDYLFRTFPADPPNSQFLDGMWGIFRVLPNVPLTKDDCKNGGWEQLGFRNQGQCVRFVETGKDSR